MTDTPKTDAAEFILPTGRDNNGELHAAQVVTADFARQLERELNSARVALAAEHAINKALIEAAEKHAADIAEMNARLIDRQETLIAVGVKLAEANRLIAQL